ncbi:MAG: hypothetical protein QXO51_07550 [Halobacteria archaeon]
MAPGVEDAVTRFWQGHRRWAFLIMVVAAFGLFVATQLFTDWGRSTRRVVVAESVFFIFTGFFMTLHHRKSKGVWMHVREIPVCHGFMGVAIQGGAVAFLLNGLGLT